MQRKKKQWLAILVIVVGLLGVGGVATATAAQQPLRGVTSSGTSVPPEVKATVLARDQATREAARNHPASSRPVIATPPASCPRVSQVDVSPFSYVPEKGNASGTLGVSGRSLINVAHVVAPDGVPYVIYAGAVESDPSQGLLIVERRVQDPCADPAGRTAYTHQIRTPSRQGAATITGIVGSNVTLVFAQGGTARFDYVDEHVTMDVLPVDIQPAPSALPTAP